MRQHRAFRFGPIDERRVMKDIKKTGGLHNCFKRQMSPLFQDRFRVRLIFKGPVLCQSKKVYDKPKFNYQRQMECSTVVQEASGPLTTTKAGPFLLVQGRQRR